MPVQRSARFLLTCLLAAAVILSSLAVASPASAGAAQDEQLFVQLINQTRASAGLPALTVHPELTREARSWAASMAASDTLAHAGDITSGITAPWTVLGENVGVHGIENVQQLHDAFVASPGHYKNIVDSRFSYIGVGVVIAEDGKLWTTHRFMATAEVEATTPPTTAPTTTTSPPTTSPPTTAPTTGSTTAPTASSTTAVDQPATSSTTSGPPTSSTTTTDAPSGNPSTTVDTDTDTSTGGGATETGTGEETDSELGEAGPGEPDLATVELMLIDLIDAGI